VGGVVATAGAPLEADESTGAGGGGGGGGSEGALLGAGALALPAGGKATVGAGSAIATPEIMTRQPPTPNQAKRPMPSIFGLLWALVKLGSDSTRARERVMDPFSEAVLKAEPCPVASAPSPHLG
jgi:hypothetical protein